MYCRKCGSKLGENKDCEKCFKKDKKRSKLKNVLLGSWHIAGTVFFSLSLITGIVLMILTIYSPNQGSTQTGSISVVAFPFILISWTAVLIGEWKKDKKKVIEKNEKITGIGGWLALFEMGIVGTLIFSLLFFIYTIKDAPYLTAYLIIFPILTLFSFYKKNKITPLLCIIFLFMNFLVELYGGDGKSMFRALFVLIIWSLYFVRSKRVRLTFVNTLKIKLWNALNVEK